MPDDVDARVSLPNDGVTHWTCISDEHLLGLRHDLVPLAGHKLTLVQQDIKHGVHQGDVFGLRIGHALIEQEDHNEQENTYQILWAISLIITFMAMQRVRQCLHML